MPTFSSYLRLLAVAGLLLSTNAAFAQGSPPGGGPGPTVPTTPDPTAVPLDGGASLLVAAGIGFGIRKLRARSRR
jgi:hypothetical protein